MMLPGRLLFPILIGAALVNGASAKQLQRLGHAPILFEPVAGPGAARFVAGAKGYRVLFESGRAVFDFGSHVASLTFSGAAPSRIAGESRVPAIRNYYRGDNPSQWSEGVPAFERIRYSRLLPGIDLVFYARLDSEIEFDLALSPGADPSLIKLRYDGFRSVEIGPGGDLLLATPTGLLKQRLPDVTQAGRRIAARYVERGAGIGIELGPYDTKRPLLIDPRISYATYLGGNNLDIAGGIAIDAAGNYFVAANTLSRNYPVLPAGQTFPGDNDIVVSKFNANNTLVYSTVIGGTLSDSAGSAAVDTDGSLFVTFTTASTNFPKPAGSTIGGGAAGSGILKLSPTGTLMTVALISASSAFGPYALTLDTNRNVWITGGTTGVPGQTGAIQAGAKGGQDIFIARLNNAITQITYFTYLGSTADENGNKIAVDSSGNVYISGNGGAADFPTGPSKAFPGAGSFVVKLDPVNNKILFATYLSAGSGGFGLVVDGDDVWVCANSTGANFTPTPDALQPTFGGGGNDAILVRLNAADGQIRYAKYLGGAGSEFANSMVQDPYGNLILFGNTTSPNFPTTADALSKSYPPLSMLTAFITVVDGGGRLLYSSYLGGSGPSDLGLAVAADKVGNAIAVGATGSVDFPATPDAFQRQSGGGQDVSIARVEFVAPADPYLVRAAIQNAASFVGGPVAPGEVITIYPHNVGPPALVTAALTADRRIATLIGGTRVLFDDVPAPMVYAANEQVSLVVPYEVQGKPFTRIVVEYNGVKSRPVVVPVTATAPGVFTTGNGSGPAVVINEDGSFNSAGAPADRGSVIAFFATGEGQTNPAGVDGRLNEFTRLEDFPKPVAPVAVTIGGQPAEIRFGAGAPGFLAGLLQFNVVVPQGVQPGPAVPLVVSVGGVASASVVTLAVR